MKQNKSEKKLSKTRILYAAAAIMVLLALSFAMLPGVRASFAITGDTPAVDESSQTPVKRGAFEVTSYDFNATVSKDHSYDVTEEISVNIPDKLESIEFAIPSGNFRVSNITVENVLYETKKASAERSVTITDPGKLDAGAHKYTIKYTIREYNDLDGSKDMFYFNVLLPEWRQPIGKVNINVTFPEDFVWDDMHCYSGQYGVQETDNKITTRINKSARKVSVTGEMIPENFGITLKAQLPEGYWEDELDGSWSITAITLIMAGVSLILLILWFIGGRDPKVKREAVTKPVEGLSPVELGYAFNCEVRFTDVLLMLIGFAQKGYLRISEYEPKRYRLYKGKRPVKEEKMYRNAFNILFEDVYKGRAIEMEDAGPRLEKIKAVIEDDVAAGFTSNDSSPFTPVSRAFRYAGAAVLGIGMGVSNAISYCYSYQTPNYIESVVVGLIAAAASLLLCRAVDERDSSPVSTGRYSELATSLLVILPVIYAAYRVAVNTRKPYAALAMVAASAVAVFLIVIMRARGKDNAVLVTRLRRLRHFISHPTPKELLSNHLEDENYYYDMLVYALAFGAEEAWAISFLTLDVAEPDWFSDDIEGHAYSNLRLAPTTIDYARDLRSFIRTFENE